METPEEKQEKSPELPNIPSQPDLPTNITTIVETPKNEVRKKRKKKPHPQEKPLETPKITYDFQMPIIKDTVYETDPLRNTRAQLKRYGIK